MDLNKLEVDQINAFANFFSFVHTWVFKKFIHCTQKLILLIYGNQAGKTGGAAFQYVLRILGYHPVPWKNVVYYECEASAKERLEADVRHDSLPDRHPCFGAGYVPVNLICEQCGAKLIQHERLSRIYRFAFETLPGQTPKLGVDGAESEIKNTQYPEFKKWLPGFLVKKDITTRNPAMVVADIYGGKDIIIEFVSYNQSTAATAGVQRLSVWCDEAPPPDFYEEQLPRLLQEDGDMIFTYTPVDRGSWLFDEFYDKAQVFYRTKAMCEYINRQEMALVEQIEHTDNQDDIAVLMAAADDNPTLSFAAIESKYAHLDPDTIAIRRYGLFRQLTGRIFKEFDYKTHYIDAKKWMPEGVPHDGWVHARGIDFHPQTPLACGNISMSPENECFIWADYNPSPEKYTMREIAKNFALMGEDYKFRLNLVDPLAVATKKDNVTVLDDLNRLFYTFKRDDIGTGAYWIPWDTHGERGRDAIHERLNNAKKCKHPYNNKVKGEDGITRYLPTLWILNTCPAAAKHMKSWRWEQWSDAKSIKTKEEKNKPEQRWSHFNMVWEAIFKRPEFKPRRSGVFPQRGNPYYFKRR